MKKLLHECMVGDVIEVPGYKGTKGGLEIVRIKIARARSYLGIVFRGPKKAGHRYMVVHQPNDSHTPYYELCRFTEVNVISEGGEDYSI
jgi:hypothetical protein